MSIEERAVRIERAGRTLDGLFHAGERALTLVMLHPHPQYGGDFDSPVVTAVRDAAVAFGASTLRFNFGSAGAEGRPFTDGDDEDDDAIAAVAFARALRPEARLFVGGYSFGALVAARVAVDTDPAALLLISPAGGAITAPPPLLRTLIVSGDDDAFIDVVDLESLRSETCEVTVVAGVDHFWWGASGHLAEAATRLLTSA